jgi:hypothetical protein
LRAEPAFPGRTIARALATLVVALWPGLALAGPPVLPPSEPQGRLEPSAPLAMQEGGNPFANTPVQRPAGLDRPAAPVQGTGPSVAPAQPKAPTAQPAPGPVTQPASARPTPPAAAQPTSAQTTSTAQPTAATPAAVPTESGPRPRTGGAPAGSTPAPTIAGDASDLDAPVPDAALVATAEPPRKRFQHKGIVADFRIGTLGCIGGLCRGAHDVSPGVRLGGFFGGNIRGWVELGIGGGWGTLGSKVAPGTNAMLLYGLDPNVLQYALLAQAAGLIDVNLSGLSVQDDQLRAAQVGPSLRVHLLPRGRFGAFVGTGVGYNVLRARYQTPMGDVGMDFHGLDVPVEANFSVYVLENLAVGMQFDYMWTWYGLAVLDHPQAKIPIPMRLLEPSAATQGIDVRSQLPQFWTLGLAIRGRV